MASAPAPPVRRDRDGWRARGIEERLLAEAAPRRGNQLRVARRTRTCGGARSAEERGLRYSPTGSEHAGPLGFV